MKRDPLPVAVTVDASALEHVAAWRSSLVALGITLAIVCACFFRTVASIVDIWTSSETYAHGFVVLPITLWLVYRMRGKLRTLTPRPSPLVLPLFAAAGFAWLVGSVGAVNALMHFAFVTMLVLTVPAVLGVHVARAMLFPLGFLFFSVPIGDFLLPTLMDHTADFTVAALRVTGVPVYREGLLLVVPNGQWSIVEACSGVRYLIASVMVGTLFAYLTYRSMWRRFAFVGVSIIVPILANWIRAYLIVLLGYLSSNRLAVGIDHIIYGWLFFGFVMLVMFWIGAKWREPLEPVRTTVTDPPGFNVTESSSRLRAAVVAAIALLAAVWPGFEYATTRHDDARIALAAVDIPGWSKIAQGDSDYAPYFQNPSATLHELVSNGGTRGGVYVAYYRNQDAQRKVANSNNRLTSRDDRTWIRTVAGTARVALDGTPTIVPTAALRGPGGASVVASQWYWINGTVTASDAIAKALVAWLRLTGRRDDSAAVVMYVENVDPTHANDALRDLAASAWPPIAAALAHESAER